MDYFLKTTSKEEFLQDMASIGLIISLEGNYFQNETLIIDWIGRIPNPIEVDEDGEIMGEVTYKEGLHVNIRSTEALPIENFQSTVDISPATPYRKFS